MNFSGHETFQCRQFWLKKGYDFVNHNGRFADDDSVIKLGVGRNMTTAIRYWLKAFGLLDDDNQLTKIAHTIFNDNQGKDQYLEDIGTIWLLHYLLVKQNHASIYWLVFNEFRRERIEFTTDQLFGFLRRKCEEEDKSVSPNTLEKDVKTFIKNYMRPRSRDDKIEDDFSTLLIDLALVQEIDRAKSGGNIRYKIEGADRDDIPPEIVLYTILDQEEGRSISFNHLLNGQNNVGVVYAMTANGLMKQIDNICKKFPGVIFSDDAGVRELQFTERPTKESVLDNYYAH